MGNEWKGRTGEGKPQQTDACSEPDECTGQADEARDARDGAGQAEKGQLGCTGTEESRGAAGRSDGGKPRGTEAAEGWREAARAVAGHNPGRSPGTGTQGRSGQGQGETVRGRGKRR